MHYGHAGPAFVRALVANGLHKKADLLKERINATARTLAGAGADSAKIRAATPVCLRGDRRRTRSRVWHLADRGGCLGAMQWAWERFCSSSDAVALDPDRQAVINIRQYIAERWDVTIKNVNAGNGCQQPRSTSAGTIKIPSTYPPTGPLRRRVVR